MNAIHDGTKRRAIDSLPLDSQPLTLGDFRSLMSVHETNEAQMKAEIVAEFMSAFPDGDPHPHREYHQAKINAANAEKEAEISRKKMYEAAVTKIAEKGIEGVFGVARILVVIALVTLAVKFGIALPAWLIK